MNLNLHLVTSDQDIEALANLASEIWNEHYIRIISQAQIDYMLDTFQSVHAITEQIDHQGYEYFMMKLDERAIGYMGIKREKYKLFLSKFYVQKAYRGQGYARQAIEFLVTLCKERGLKAIWLTVNRYNDIAIKFYERQGFTALRTQVADIGHGYVMDDFIMEREI